MENKEKIKAFLSRYFKNQILSDDEDIFERGIVNSLFAIQLIMFVEKEFYIDIGNDEVNMDNFRSINSITSLINSKVN